jgi:hypothetical protein
MPVLARPIPSLVIIIVMGARGLRECDEDCRCSQQQKSDALGTDRNFVGPLPQDDILRALI